MVTVVVGVVVNVDDTVVVPEVVADDDAEDVAEVVPEVVAVDETDEVAVEVTVVVPEFDRLDVAVVDPDVVTVLDTVLLPVDVAVVVWVESRHSKPSPVEASTMLFKASISDLHFVGVAKFMMGKKPSHWIPEVFFA